MINGRKGIDLDRVGAIASATCAVHCFITAVAFGFLSVAGLGFLANETTDKVFFAVAVVLGSFAVWSGYRKHHSWKPALIFGAGVILVIVSHFILGHAHVHGPHAESLLVIVTKTALAVGAGLTLVSFHLVNARLIKQRC